jgi:hypothetical protein
MATIARMRVTWSGAQVVGPGLTTLYLTSSVSAGWPAAVVTLFTALKNFVPTGVTWTIPGTVDLIDDATGALVGANTPGGGGQVLSSGGAVDYKPGVGGRIRWTTNAVVAGRKVTGTTFIVPMTSQETPNGVIQGTTVNSITTAANAYRSTAGIQPGVWSRPASGRPGSTAIIAGVAVPSGITWLRTRRT